MWAGRAGGGLGEGAHDDAAGELDLEAVVAGRARLGDCGVGGLAERRPGPAWRRPGRLRRPGRARVLGGDAAERDAGLDDPAILQM